MAEGMMLADKAAYDKILEESNNKLVVIDFTATWCPPCQMIGPKFVALSEDAAYKDKAIYKKCDVDANKEASEAAGIQCMPTFKFYKGGKEVDKLEGANEAKLKELIDKNA